ncbi:hypothetical protein PGT21_021857 [Puccinia graminis f. sp. tritici]|uniref:Uncharacterized protein n=2 Tax=Puccinia graminis f. sp. tritici TaxID=56615 RepID=E3KX16_PUCGT|nr:uncharacterized protein PGTG_14248 [Puccinia graminis f. sp. tritici CRL 75-36-700-3]EFP88909.2 hypothetical protein PGTG_14248 [Puccinia graminis f. sp. tritici CRL 75-36-700-3]KAA1113117.1 hypothetical protein PGT21_021857 [Puccinia graminis f. sp. tritici]
MLIQISTVNLLSFIFTISLAMASEQPHNIAQFGDSSKTLENNANNSRKLSAAIADRDEAARQAEERRRRYGATHADTHRANQVYSYYDLEAQRAGAGRNPPAPK